MLNNRPIIVTKVPARNTLRFPYISANLAAGTIATTDTMKKILAIHPNSCALH